MMNRMIVANLRRRPVRSLVSVLAVAIEVALILMIVGLTDGMVNDQRARINGIGADVVVRSGSGSMFAALTGNALPLKMAPAFAQVPGVAAVAGQGIALNQATEAVGGIDLDSFDAVSGGFRFLQGRAFRPGTQEVIVDDLEADAKHLKVGQPMTLLGQPFLVVGIFEHGMGPRLDVDLPVLDRLAGSPGKVAMFWIKVHPPGQTAAVVAALQKMVPNETVDSMAQYLSMFTASQISPALPIFQRVMVGIAVAIGFLVIFLSLYTTVLERTREIGILKALGASRGYIVQVILRESELLAGLGVIVGTLIAFALWRFLARAYPTLPIEMTWSWVGWSALIAFASSAIGALYPAFKAASQDAISALAYE